MTSGKRNTPAAVGRSCNQLRDCTEETWDMVFDTKNALHTSDRNYLKIIDPVATLSNCSHQLVRILCPCGVKLKARECTECNFYLCGSDCSAMERASKGTRGSERSSIGPSVLRTELEKIGSGWIATTDGFYICSRNLKKEAQKQLSQVILKSFGTSEGIKRK